jgi:hypothetical protein
MNSSISSSDPQAGAGWGRWLKVYAAIAAGGLLGLYGLVVLADPFSTGRFTPFTGVEVAISARTLANAGRIRDPAFDSAIGGNSHAIRIEPEKLDALTGRHFLQLAIPGLGPDNQLTMLRAFARQRSNPARTVIVTLDQFWCETDEQRLYTDKTFPAWLYQEGNDRQYLTNIFSLDAIQASFHRIAIKLGLAPEPARRDGYVPREARGIWTPERVASLATEQRPTAARIPPTGFPALERLDAFLKSIDPKTEAVLVFLPYHTSVLPVPGSAAASWLSDCKARAAGIAKSRPGTAFIDRMVENAVTRDAGNFWDATHVRDHIVRGIEKDIAEALRGR